MARRWLLLVTIVLAVLITASTGIGLIALDSRTTAADALRTAGFAGGSVVGLYALWLNDRRRRVDEQRQELDRRKADADRDRVADERFARAVELLGSEAEQVRVGAMHALAGLAHSRPDYTQTVINVLCSYLQQPFEHPRYDDTERSWTENERHDAERKLTIRLTAQRLLTDLLPAAGDQDAPHYDVDLTGAVLEYFDLSHRGIGRLVMRYTRLYSSNNFSHCQFHGPVWFTGTTTSTGRTAAVFRCTDTVFHDRAWFKEASFGGHLNLAHSQFHGPVKFRGSSFRGPVSAEECVFHGDTDLMDTEFHGAADMKQRTLSERQESLSRVVDQATQVIKETE